MATHPEGEGRSTSLEERESIGASTADTDGMSRTAVDRNRGESPPRVVENLKSSTVFKPTTCTSTGGDVGDREAAYDDSSANRFRSNVEIIEKPRQMIVLLVTIAGASYLVSLTSNYLRKYTGRYTLVVCIIELKF